MADENPPIPIAEITHDPSKFDAFLERNQKRLVILAIVAALGVVAALVFNGLGEMKRQAAGSKLAMADSDDELRAAMDGAPKKTANTAKLLLAVSQAEEAKDFKTAIATLEDLLGSNPGPSIKRDAELRLALIQIEADQPDKAKLILENIVADPNSGYTKVLAEMVLGDIALKNGELEESKKYYESAEEAAKFAATWQEAAVGVRSAAVLPPTLIIKKEPEGVNNSGDVPAPPEGIAAPPVEPEAPSEESPIVPELDPQLPDPQEDAPVEEGAKETPDPAAKNEEEQ